MNTVIFVAIGFLAFAVLIALILVLSYKNSKKNETIKDLEEQVSKKNEDLNILKDYAREDIVIQKDKNEKDKEISNAKNEEELINIANDIVNTNNKLRNNKK